MPKPTLKDLENQVLTLRDLREGDKKHMEWQTAELNRLRELVKCLEADKSWLKSMHSNMLQATSEMFRNR